VPLPRETEIHTALERHPELTIVSVGSRMELFNGIGLPEEVGTRFGLARMSGTHAIGHARMATESAVTPEGGSPALHRFGSVPGA